MPFGPSSTQLLAPGVAGVKFDSWKGEMARAALMAEARRLARSPSLSEPNRRALNVSSKRRLGLSSVSFGGVGGVDLSVVVGSADLAIERRVEASLGITVLPILLAVIPSDTGV